MSAGTNVFGRVSIAVVTPFVDASIDVNQPIDNNAVIKMITFIASELAPLRSKFDLIGGIILSGTTGEQHTMTINERITLYKLAVQTSSGFNVPIIAGIAATTTMSVTQLTNGALEAGCEGIMLGLPPYCRLCDDEIQCYILSVRKLLPDGFPLLLYNNAMRNGYGPSLNLIAKLCADGTLWGVKHAVAPDVFLSQASQLLELDPSLKLYTGSDKMSAVLLNCSEDSSTQRPRFFGLTSIMGNLFPSQVVTMAARLTHSPALREEDQLNSTDSIAAGMHLHETMTGLMDATLVGCSLPVGLKYAMRQKGLDAGYTRQPTGHLSDSKMSEIDEALLSYDVGIVNKV